MSNNDNRVVHVETRKNSGILADIGFEGSRSATVTLNDGRVGRGDGASDARAVANAIRNANQK